MSKPPIFNDYNENGERLNIAGCRSTIIADNNLRDNLRQRWGAAVSGLSDVELVNEYDEFALSDMFGDNDERFLEWLSFSIVIGNN